MKLVLSPGGTAEVKLTAVGETTRCRAETPTDKGASADVTARQRTADPTCRRTDTRTAEHTVRFRCAATGQRQYKSTNYNRLVYVFHSYHLHGHL